MAALCAPAQAASTFSVVSAIVTNPLTGAAIDGFDPVSYFTDGQARQGSPDFEYRWNGVSWYFTSAANREVFKRAPDIYAPQFGGHGAMSMARGFVSDGNPRLFVIYKEKLYLFYSAANRDAFILAPEKAADDAAANWPRLAQELTSQ